MSLPPTGVMAGHPESFPPTRIMSEPIDELVQSHVVEHGSHAPGAKPGVIVSYDCDRFACEPDLVARLSRIVERYPDGVYLAPYPRMQAKIALTTLGKSETLDVLDEARITAFVAAQPGVSRPGQAAERSRSTDQPRRPGEDGEPSDQHHQHVERQPPRGGPRNPANATSREEEDVDRVGGRVRAHI